jgi:pantoate--beta-alanine ligase
MRKLESIAALRAFVQNNRKAGKTISFVPTMGAIHEGHMELVRQGLAKSDVCIPYIFLNPKQFAPTEDLGSYPQPLDADLERLKTVNSTAVYLPRPDEIYPDGFSTSVKVANVSQPLEGECRPHFFEGVATVVSKMLIQCQPDIALFGEKDFQQLQVIKRMVKDLNIPVEIFGVPTVRDSEGLALSSRNAYLSDDQYQVAIQLNKILAHLAGDVRLGKDVASAEKEAHDDLLKAGFASVDYVTVRDANTFGLPLRGQKDLRVLAAVRVGKARLIDNMPVWQ